MNAKKVRALIVVASVLLVLSGIAGISLDATSAQAGAAIIVLGVIGLVAAFADSRAHPTRE